MDKVGVLNFWSLREKFIEEGFSFWMISCYLFVEYVRPQSIMPALDVLPWGKLFLVLSGVSFMLQKKKVWVKSFVNKPLIWYLILVLVSSAYAIDPDFSRKNWVNYFGWVISFFLIINLVNNRMRFYIFVLIFFAASLKLSIFGSYTWALRGVSFTSWGIKGPPGFFENSGEYAIQMLMFFPLALGFMWASWSRAKLWEKAILVAMVITPILAIMAASSRGAQLALLVQLIFLFRKKIFSAKYVLFALSIGFSALLLLPDEQKDRFKSIGDDKSSRQRMLYIENGVEMIQNNPMLGVGYFNFPIYYTRHYRSDMLFKHAEHPHNLFIQVGSDVGIPGLVVYMLIVFGFFRTANAITVSPEDQLSSSLRDGLVVGVVGFLVAAQFVSVVYYPFFWIALAFVVALKNINDSGVKGGLWP